MNTHADKTSENKSQSVANSLTKLESSGESTFQFVDNRPEAIAQRKLQEMANNSPRALQLKVLQEMANNSPQSKQAAQLKAMAKLNTATPIQQKTENGITQLVNAQEEEELIQGKFDSVQHQGNESDSKSRENKTGLPGNLKAGVESLSDVMLDKVKVHYNSAQPAQLNALAYGQGRVLPTMQLKEGGEENDDVGLEKEADVMEAKALQKMKQNLAGQNASANISNATPLTTAQLIIKPDIKKKAFMLNYQNKTQKIKEAIGNYFDSVKGSALLYSPEEMHEGIRKETELKGLKALFAKMEQDKSAEIDEDLGGERAHGVSRHLTISDKDLEARLQGPRPIPVATRFQIEKNAGGGRTVLKLYRQIKANLPVFLKKHVEKVATDVLETIRDMEYQILATNNAARRTLILNKAEINDVITEDFDGFYVSVNWEVPRANCLPDQATIKCVYTVESTDDFAKDSWSLNPMGVLVKDSIDEIATMHSGSNSPVITVLDTDTPDSITEKVAASNVDMVGVTMY